MTMPNAANYSSVERLRDGRQIEIRSFRPEDRDELTSTVARVGALSLYRRFFTLKQSFSEREKAFFLNVDFEKHVALVAMTEEAGRQVMVGGARYVIVQPGKAEVAFLVVDQYQGQGIGAALLRNLANLARAGGLNALVAEVLRENTPMLKVFEKSGLPMTTTRDPDVSHVTLQLA
jgi:RimJ/RimL family protein N-acetyltransferase